MRYTIWKEFAFEAAVLFLGGSTRWKWASIGRWASLGRRLHVGRVNGYPWLWRALEAGAESCDGTGWLRGRQRQLRALRQFLEESSGGHPAHPQQSLTL